MPEDNDLQNSTDISRFLELAVIQTTKNLVAGFSPSEKYERQLGWWHSQYINIWKVIIQLCSKPARNGFLSFLPKELRGFGGPSPSTSSAKGRGSTAGCRWGLANSPIHIPTPRLPAWASSSGPRLYVKTWLFSIASSKKDADFSGKPGYHPKLEQTRSWSSHPNLAESFFKGIRDTTNSKLNGEMIITIFKSKSFEILWAGVLHMQYYAILLGGSRGIMSWVVGCAQSNSKWIWLV